MNDQRYDVPAAACLVCSNLSTILGVMLFVLTSCTAESQRLQAVVDDGIGITKRVNFSASPGEKLEAAHALLQHAKEYDPLVSGAAQRESERARRFQRQEREKAATLMREAAGDSIRQGDKEKARQIYQRIIQEYSDDEYQHIRGAAENSLKELDRP